VTDDPLATPTLARLYLEQGHFDRARAILRAALARNPYDGVARVLVARLAPIPAAGLRAAGDRAHLEVRWHRVERPHTAFVTVRWYDARGAELGGQQFACETAAGSRRLPWPGQARAAACSIRRCDATPACPVPIAVAPAVARPPAPTGR